MDKITLLGISPIGVSIALGLKRAGLKNAEIVGSDRRRSSLTQATKMGAIDRATGNLRSAMEGARLVIMDSPLAETRELMEAIGPLLEDGAILTDTGSAKRRVMEWAGNYLNTRATYVGGRPLPSKAMTELEDADPGVFEDTRYCVIPSQSAEPRAIETLVGVIETLGAKPLFMDVYEHDSYAAAMDQLPVILSSALVGCTTAPDSWKEMARMAGTEFREVSGLAANDPEDSAVACNANADALSVWLDQMIAELTSYRDSLKDSGDGLAEKFIHSWEERAKWEMGAVVEPTGPRIPSAFQSMGGVFLSRRLLERQQKIEDRDKGAPWKYRRRK